MADNLPVLSNPTSAATPNVLTGPQKAAVIIALLGAESAPPIIEKLRDDHLRSFVSSIESLQRVPRPLILAAIADFVATLKAQQGSLRGGAESAKALAQSLFEERAEKILGRPNTITTGTLPSDQIWAKLRLRKTTDISEYLSSQRAEVASTVLSQLPTDQASEILSELPQDLSIVCIRQMSSSAAINPATIEAVAELVEIEYLNQEKDTSADESISFVGEILSIVPKSRRDLMLESLDKNDPEKAKLIRDAMMTFEDLPTRLPTSAVPIIFRDFEADTLLKSLKASQSQAPNVAQFLFANISQRMAGQYKEQVEDLSEITDKQGDAAISSLMAFVSKLEREGRITLIKPIPEQD